MPELITVEATLVNGPSEEAGGKEGELMLIIPDVASLFDFTFTSGDEPSSSVEFSELGSRFFAMLGEHFYWLALEKKGPLIRLRSPRTDESDLAAAIERGLKMACRFVLKRHYTIQKMDLIDVAQSRR